MFRNVEGNNAALHLVKFHIHVHKLKINFPEDCLMKMFMATLEDEARSWYESLPSASIYCLKDFHTMFFEKYKESYPSLNLVQNCCSHVHSFIENLENFHGDNELMDGEIMEALYENPFQQHKENLDDICQDDQDILQQNQDQQAEDGHMVEDDEREGSISDLPTEEDSVQSSQDSISECDAVKSAISDQHLDHDDQEYLMLKPIKENFAVEIIWNAEDTVMDPNVLSHTVSPSLEHSLHEEAIQSVHEKQDEIFVQVSEKSYFDNSLVNDNLIAMSYEDNYYLSKRKQKALSPLSEEEIDQLLKGQVTTQAKADLQCTLGQENVGKTSSSFEKNDSLVISFVDQQTDKAVMFDNLEDCFLFKNDLDHEVERDNMPEFFMVKEPTASTQMAKADTSLCISLPWKSIALLDQNGESTCIFAAGSPNKIVLQDYQDPCGILLQALEKINVVWFIIISFGFSGYFELPTGSSFCLLEISESRNLVCSHLLDWLHWKAHYT